MRALRHHRRRIGAAVAVVVAIAALAVVELRSPSEPRVAVRAVEAKLRAQAVRQGTPITELTCARTSSAPNHFFCFGENVTGAHLGFNVEVHRDGSLVVRRP
jgi:hypothetical protein